MSEICNETGVSGTTVRGCARNFATLAALTSPCTSKIAPPGRPWVARNWHGMQKMPRRQTKRNAGNTSASGRQGRKSGERQSTGSTSPRLQGVSLNSGLPGPFGTAQIDLPESAGATYGCHTASARSVIGSKTGCRHPWRGVRDGHHAMRFRQGTRLPGSAAMTGRRKTNVARGAEIMAGEWIRSKDQHLRMV